MEELVLRRFRLFESHRKSASIVITLLADLVCWSRFGYQRLARLFCVAIAAETEKPQLRKNLLQRLLVVISTSGDATIAEKIRGSLSSDAMEVVESSFAKDHLSAWVLLPSSDWGSFVGLSLNGDSVASS